MPHEQAKGRLGKNVRSLPRHAALLITLVVFPAGALHAQSADHPPQEVEAAQEQYPASDFEIYAPQTALDLVRLLPGFIIREAEQRRGIGINETNLLINGRRIVGTLDDAEAALARIPFGDVVRVEVGEASALGFSGLSGTAANFIISSSDFSGQFSWNPELRVHRTAPVLLDGSISLSGRAGSLSYSVGFENESIRDRAAGPETVFASTGTIVDQRQEVFVFDFDRPRLSLGLGYEGSSGDRANLNAVIARTYFDFEEISVRLGPSLPDRTRTLVQRQRERSWEISTDYQFPLAGGALKLIVLHRDVQLPITTAVRTEQIDPAKVTGSFFDQDREETQSTFRAEQEFSTNSGNWTLAAEYSLVRFENNSAFAVLDDAGERTDIVVPGSNGQIEEDRVEATISRTGKLSDTLEYQITIGAEHSWLRQLGFESNARQFFRPKGVGTLSWQAASSLQLFAELRRRIGQIEFFDFLASVDLTDEQRNLANPQLRPPESWDFEIGGTRQFPGLSRLTTRLYARDISNLVDRIPVGTIGDATGNIESAFLYGIEVDGTLDLGRMGFAGARLDARFQLQESELDDPVIGGDRRIANNLRELIDISFRRDTPGSDWAWGGEFDYLRRAPDFRFDQIAAFRQGATGSLFIENKDVLDLRLRATATRSLGDFEQVDRTRFVENRSGSIDAIERRRRDKGFIFMFSVGGTF